MCGRYTITVSMEELMLRFMLEQPLGIGHYMPRYNIAPGQWIPAIIGGTSGSLREKGAASPNRLGQLRWGLVPSWSKEESSGSKPINIRADTVEQKPAFRTLLERKRCIVPADGFYEWKSEGRHKQPVRFVLKDRSLFGMAAIYDSWLLPDGSKLHTCAVLTTEPNTLVAQVHQRMPVILRQEDEPVWLDRSQRQADVLIELCRPYDSGRMSSYEVDPMVGNVRNDRPECVAPVHRLL